MIEMRSGFITDITGLKEKSITEAIKVKAGVSKKLDAKLFKVTLTFYQAKSRYKTIDQDIPRGDRGDLDNLIKLVIDGIGHIIGYRQSWEKINGKLVGSKSDNPLDSKIIEIVAKKINSGSEKEYVGIIIEGL